MENNIVNVQIENIDEKQIPDLIQNQFTQMTELRKEIEGATNNAYDAKEMVINEVTTTAQGSKAAIESLQSATLSLANAQVDAIKAQTKSFEYQQKLGDITKFLFRLGLSNISMNRIVVEELEKRLKHASQEELDDLAKNEIQNLLKQLKEQQDVYAKQEELTKLVKEESKINASQQKEIDAQAQKDIEHDQKIEELYGMIVKQDEMIRNLMMDVNELKTDVALYKSMISHREL